MKLIEGGNVFKNGNGQALTQRINQTDIDPTVTWLEELTGLDLHGELDPDTADQSHPQGYPERWLGSTGKKESSGDLDLGIDAREFTKDQMVARLSQWCQSHGFKPEEYIKKSGSIVHFKTPITGRPQNGYVQTDFTFLAKPKWSQFVLSGGLGSQYQGRERNVMMNSIAKAMGYKLNQNDGIMDRATNQLITDDPDKVAKILLNPRATRADLRNVEGILKALEKDPKRDAKLADFRAHMEREGLPFLESTMESADPYIEYNEVNFLARLRDRIVNQGMKKLIESEVQGGRAKGIEHLEDYVFRNGSAGIKKAIDIAQHTAEATGQTTTVKWDGKPALVFGRNVAGTFILTDVAGFGAKGYNGLFTSPRQVRKHLAARDAEAAAQGRPATRVQDLSPIYDKLWGMLDSAVPQNYRGFFQGDLLYINTPPLEAGNYVFTPNTVEYKIPANSDIGQRIGDSDVGIAMHTQYAEPGAPKEPIGNFKFKTVPGLLLLEPVYAKEDVKLNRQMLAQLKDIYKTQGAAIDQLFNPNELRAAQITDLPKLCIDYINSRVGTNFDQLVNQFGEWLLNKAGPRKFKNTVEYLQSPRSNLAGLAAAFEAWSLLHNIKMDMLQQLDLQHPGQEGWVMATPAGLAKAVNRLAGGFTSANRQINNPEPAANS
jgi:hypothetical protein